MGEAGRVAALGVVGVGVGVSSHLCPKADPNQIRIPTAALGTMMARRVPRAMVGAMVGAMQGETAVVVVVVAVEIAVAAIGPTSSRCPLSPRARLA